jgi:hypothetical protein
MLIPLALVSMIGVASTPPVKLATCEVSTPVTAEQGDGVPVTFGSFALHVRFSNTAQQPISRVTFTLDDGTKVVDVGTFSPGITINHALGLENGTASSCAVTSVEFANGATWRAGLR